MSRTISTSVVTPGGKLLCTGHNLEAIIKISHSQNNPNRKYWSCPVRTESRCTFFYWADDPIFQQTPVSTSPTTSQHHPRSSSSTTTSHSSTSTLNRNSSTSTFPTDYSGMSPSEKRLAQIQQALNSPPDAPSSARTHQPSHTPTFQRSTTHTTSIRSRPSAHTKADLDSVIDIDTDLDLDNDAEMTPPSPISQPPIYAGHPPARRRRGLQHDHDPFEDEDEFFHSPAPFTTTPTRYRRQADFPSPPISSPKRRRPNPSSDDDLDDTNYGTVSAYVTPMSSPARAHPATLHDFEPPTNTRSHVKPLIFARLDTPSSSGIPTNSQMTSTSDNEAPPKPEPEASSEAFWALANSWSTVPAYVKKLERRTLALEKSNEFKAKKILEQKQEIGRLLDRIQSLEETSKARRY